VAGAGAARAISRENAERPRASAVAEMAGQVGGRADARGPRGRLAGGLEPVDFFQL
jgi:hypothetical protein